jgi:micrococcal nuclease
MIRRGGCLTALLLAGALVAGAGGGIPAALKGVLEAPATHTARVVRVIDGDTLLVRRSGRSERVRLLGADAPEANSTRRRRSECGGRLATSATRSWVTRAQRQVALARDRLAPERDRHGRLLATVSSPRGDDLARWLVSRGLARTASYGSRPLVVHPRLLALEAKARGRRAGLWSKCPGWAREHSIPFASLRAAEADQRPPVAPSMAALPAVLGARR